MFISNESGFVRVCLGHLKKRATKLTSFWKSDEVHFHLSGFVNKQIFRYWSDTNSRLLYETVHHSQKFREWRASLANGSIGSLFFENEVQNLVIVNSVRYAAMIRNFLTPRIAYFSVNEDTLFQQDEATSHTASILMNTVNALFSSRIISRNGDIP